MAQAGQRYVSSELAHFVGKGLKEEQQYQLFLKILNEGWITHPPHDPKISGNLLVNTPSQISSNMMYSPDIVCFCDIPIADLSIHVAKYSPFALSFSKDFIVQQGGCPVFYLPKQASVHVRKKPLPEGNIGKGQYFDKMTQEYSALMQMFRSMITQSSELPNVQEALKRLMELERFIDFHIFSYIKFYDHSCADDHDDNYYLEREWRVIGNVKFDSKDIETVFMPKRYCQKFREDCPSYESQVIFIGETMDRNN